MKKTSLTRLIIPSLFCVVNASAVEYQSPRTLALGGAGRAAPLLNDSIYLNPSFASYHTIYSAQGGYNWFNQGRNYNASVQDARDPLLQAGVGYTWREQNTAVNIGASHKVFNQLSAGLGDKIIIDRGTNKLTDDFTFSTSFIATQWMYASLIVDNILETEAGRNRDLWRTFFLAFKFIPTREVGIYVDPLFSPDYNQGNRLGVAAGVEVAMLADLYLRFGKFADSEISFRQTRGSGYSLGIGWIGPKINFDYSLMRVTSSHTGPSQDTSNSVSATIFI